MTARTMRGRLDSMETKAIDMVIPVYNEERDLVPSVRRLHAYLEARFPFPATITIVDNASTDATWPIAEYLASELPNVRAIHLDAKGRGRALRTAWLSSDASIVAYMDVDLSTDLDARLPLVAPLVSGDSEVAIGSRLARGARVRRGAKRALISRAYNFILHLGLGTKFSDAQRGFKAITAVAAPRLAPGVEDQAWFFVTELLVVAEPAGVRIREVRREPPAHLWRARADRPLAGPARGHGCARRRDRHDLRRNRAPPRDRPARKRPRRDRTAHRCECGRDHHALLSPARVVRAPRAPDRLREDRRQVSTLSLSPARLFPAARERFADARSDAWVRPALIAVTVLAAFLYFWHLSINGYANTYYSAAALAASESWKAWFFGSFDAGSFITVDK